MSEAPLSQDRDSSAEVDALLGDLYASISFARGGQPELARLRELLHPRALLFAAHGEPARAMGPEDFIGAFEAQIEAGTLHAFRERELGRRTQRFGKVMHVLSAYQTEMDSGDEQVRTRGVNSIQLVQQSGRWWVLSIVWDNEGAGNQLPSGLTRGR